MIYVHVPFCHRKCTYCAFHSKPVHGDEDVAGYVDAVLAEMEQRCGEMAHPVSTVYFGGGTPSLLSAGALGRIVGGLRRWFDLSRLEEFTLEANPEDLSRAYLSDLRALGFNRLSIGVQSLDDEVLRLLNRRHTAAEAMAAVEAAHAAGFRNISVDFIYGLPREFRFPTFNYKLVTHVSAYALGVEPGTALAKQVEQGRVVLPDDEEVVRQYHELRQRLEAEGFGQYEVSNYARPGYESRHNSRYWDRTPYLGLGPGAHSFALSEGGSASAAHGGKRRWNLPDNELYVSSFSSFSSSTRCTGPWYEEEQLTPADAINELLMTTLRTTRGLLLSAVPAVFRAELQRKVQPYIDCGWLVSDGNCLRPSSEGLLHADGMAAALFSEAKGR